MSPAHNKKHIKSQVGGEAGELFLVATPIGNLGDISSRALEVLTEVALIACEDTRTSGVLLNHYGIRTPTTAYHAHNEAEATARLLEKLKAGERIALISDAGTPLLSDPGARLVAAAIETGLRVTPIPGASALLAALSMSGLPAAPFFFAGFLPGKTSAREMLLAQVASLPATLVFYEAPHRLAETLAQLADALDDRPAAVAREITKLHETCHRGRLRLLAQAFAEKPPKGECVILVAGAEEATMTQETIDEALHKELAAHSLREAVDRVTAFSRRARSEIYERALELRKERK